MTPEMTEQIFPLTLAVLSAVVSMVLIPSIRAGGKHLAGLLESKGADARFSVATMKTAGLLSDAIGEVEQTFVRRMKAKGEWDGDAAKLARDTAVEVTKRHLGDGGIAEVMEGFGIKDPAVFDGKLRTMVESIVDDRSNGAGHPGDKPSEVFVPMAVDGHADESEAAADSE